MNNSFVRPLALAVALVTAPTASAAPPVRAAEHAQAAPRVVIAMTHAQGRVTGHRAPLTVHLGPGVGYPVIGRRPAGSLVDLARVVLGSRVHGDARWYRLADEPGYVSAHYILSDTRLTRPRPRT
ncbi:hypothetical protein [Nonomuraea sp. NPDC052265]|uniref:hypothetical protein n=1 Tax=Nonomuraea sp. NPDC052265 TaxID=3364374 RepID=UPI0037C5E1B4